MRKRYNILKDLRENSKDKFITKKCMDEFMQSILHYSKIARDLKTMTKPFDNENIKDYGEYITKTYLNEFDIVFGRSKDEK
jgi:hypothetical protein